MKSARWYGKEDVRIDNIPDLEFNDDQIKIKVKWAGISATDIHEYLNIPILTPVKPNSNDIAHSVPMGHEFSGEVVEVGKNVKYTSVGDRVVVEPLISFGSSNTPQYKSYTFNTQLNGAGFSEYAIVSENRVHKLPEPISYEMGALVQPISVGLEAIKRSKVNIGDTAVVVGAGPIGLTIIEGLKSAGAKSVIAIELSQKRKELASLSGADIVIDPNEIDPIEEIYKLTKGKGADISFEVTGVQAGFNICLDAIKAMGRLIVVSTWNKSISIDLNKIVLGEKEILGTLCYNKDIFETAIKWVSDKKIKANGWISKKIYIDDLVSDGFKMLTGKNKNEEVRILVTPDSSLIKK
ncbi:MAG: 2,3-butanediol dehydrogenase [Psittacicella sp.]